ncbi:MAG: hypothetical protein ACW98K_10680, partial [Candidatus Kariarchaeaceae archaeon]
HPANSSLIEGTYIGTRLEAIGAISYKDFGLDQRGSFVAPIRPVFSNLEVESSLIGMRLHSTLDTFQNVSKAYFHEEESVYFGDEFPFVSAEGNNLDWFNISRNPFDKLIGLEEGRDYSEFVFTSRTDFAATETTVVVPFIYPEAKRHVRIDPWGNIFVSETITVMHNGGALPDDAMDVKRAHAIGAININVHGSAIVTDVFDDHGSLNTNLRLEGSSNLRTTLDPQSYKQVFATIFRNPIYGGETYTFTVEYRLNPSELILVSGSTYTMNTTIFSDYNTTISKLDVVFELPAGATLKQQTFQSKSRTSTLVMDTGSARSTLSFFRHVELHYTLYNASIADNGQFQIIYSYRGIGPIGLGHVQYIVTFMLVVGIFLSIILLAQGVKFTGSPTIEIAREQVPIDKIETFFNLFRERSGASKRIAELRERRKKGKISKKDFDGQIKAIERRIRTLNPQLDEAARNLSAVGTKYESLVSKVMIASQKQKDIRSNTTNVRRTYRKGETPKDIYQKLMREYSKDLERQESLINRSLSEMHELIQQYS